jgi:hypothetical protein
MTKTTFRRLIILWWSVGLVCIVVTLSTQKYLPSELSSYLAAKANADPTPIELTGIIIGVALLVALIIGSIGLYLFKAWSRDLFLLTNVLGLFLTPFFGPSVMSEWASGICYVSSLLTGGLLFSLYLAPMKGVFQGKPEKDRSPGS